VRFLPLLPEDRLRFQISNFSFRIPPAPQPSTLDSRLSTQSPYLRDTQLRDLGSINAPTNFEASAWMFRGWVMSQLAEMMESPGTCSKCFLL
jgi:hypothetical protein